MCEEHERRVHISVYKHEIVRFLSHRSFEQRENPEEIFDTTISEKMSVAKD